MSSLSASTVKSSVEALYKKSIDSSSIDPPMEEWSSLIIQSALPDSEKVKLYKEGLYSPGSGEICAKYIAMSDSSVLRHVYYNYPTIKDPGIMDALLKAEPSKTYECDGQELYLDLCTAMNVVPVRMFHRNLLNSEIDLKFYGVNPVGVRAMSLALVNNKYVKRLDLTSNHLSVDACYHLGQLLGDSFALQELVLAGCKIGPEGVRQLVVRLSFLELLDLSKNDICDEGFQYLVEKLMRKAVVKRLNVSHNNLTGVSGKALAEALARNNTITHLDMSWNKLFAVKELLLALGQSEVLTELNLSWNAIAGGPFTTICSLRNLQVLDVSSNRLSTPTVKAIVASLRVAKSLKKLDLSRNNLTPADALLLIEKMKDKVVKLQNLYMEDTCVDKQFVETLKEVLGLKFRANATVKYGDVLKNYTLAEPADLKLIVMKRLDYVTRAAKKCKIDIAIFFLQTRKEYQIVEPRDLVRQFKITMAPVNDDLLEGLCTCFPGPRTEKGGKTINLDGVVEYIQRLWPDKKCPPTPPPEPEPVKPVKKGKKK